MDIGQFESDGGRIDTDLGLLECEENFQLERSDHFHI